MADFGGGLGSFLGGIFNDYEAPFRESGKAARPWFNRAAGNFDPYTQAGQRGVGNYENWLNGMSNPSDFINSLMNNYQESPWAKFSQDQAMRAGTNAASASGTLGSTPFANEMQQMGANISSQDMQNWLSQVLGINNQVGQGWNNIMNNGLNAAGSQANIFGQRGNMEGALSGGQAAAGNQRWNDILGGLGNMFGATGGFF